MFQIYKVVLLPSSFNVKLQRHTGQFNSSSRFPSTKFSKHFLQKECKQSSVRGSSNVSRQIEHSSKFFRSCLWSVGSILLAEAILNESGLVVLRKEIKNRVNWLQMW
jgi:hypothetical protein